MENCSSFTVASVNNNCVFLYVRRINRTVKKLDMSLVAIGKTLSSILLVPIFQACHCSYVQVAQGRMQTVCFDSEGGHLPFQGILNQRLDFVSYITGLSVPSNRL